MPEQNDNQTENVEEIEQQKNAPEEVSPVARRRFFTPRNLGISVAALGLLVLLLAVSTVVVYRYGYFDTYVKGQFVAKMNDIGIVFDADVFRVTVAPLQLELKNATFNDKLTGEKLFFIRDARLGLTIQDLYAWQLSRDIKIDTTDIVGAEVWVKFDENGKSNFANLNIVEERGRVNFLYTSTVFSLKEGTIHFGNVTRKITADAKNVAFFLEPENAAVPDEQKRYKFDFTSTDSNFKYDESVVQPIDIRAKGIADGKGAEVTELKLTSPIGESNLSGTITDWEEPKYDLNINSTVDLTQTSNIFPLGTTIRGVGNFTGKVTGGGEKYRIEGEIQSDALAATNIRLKALKANAAIDFEDSFYNANGKAIAELLTFEDFQIDFPQLVGNVRGTGTDFRWVGELQAAAAKTPAGTIAGLFISDAVAEYKDSQLNGNFGTVRAQKFSSEDIEIQSLLANNLKISNADGTTTATTSQARAETFKTNKLDFKGVTASNLKIKDVPARTDFQADRLQAQTGTLGDAKLKNITANSATVGNEKGTTTFTAKDFRAGQVDANGVSLGEVSATNLDVRDVPTETVVASKNLKLAKVETDAAVLGSLNIAGVRLTIRQGRIEATSGDINAGNVALTNKAVDGGGNLENVVIYKPVFVLEPSGRYRASADMSLGGGVLGSVKLGAARASVVAENEQIALNNLAADVMDGKVNGNAVIALNNRRRSVVNAEFSNLDLSKLLALQGGRVVPIEGKTTGNANLTFAGTNFKTASGSLTADFAANAGTAERGLVPVNGRLGLRATNGLFDIDYANLNTEKSRLNATGSFDLNGYNSNLNLALNSTDAAEIERIVEVLNVAPELDRQLDEYKASFGGNLTFNGTLTGNLNDPTIDGRAAVDSLILRGRDVGSLATNIFVSPDMIELRDGRLQERGGGNLAFNVSIPDEGTNNVSVQATLNNINTGNLFAALPVDFIPEQVRDLQAQTSGTINISGIPNNLQGEANITSGGGTIRGEKFDGFTAKATFAGTLVNVENFNVRFGEGSLQARGTYTTDTKTFNFDVKGENLEFARVRPFIPNNEALTDLNGVVDLTAKAAGTTTDTRTFDINFSGAGRNVFVNGNQVGAVTFVGKTENQQLNANLTVNFENQPQTIAASVNFADENLPFRAETVFNNTELAPYIALVRPTTEGDVSITGRANGRVFVEGNLYGTKADGTRGFTTDNLSGAANFDQLALQIGETPLVASEPVSVRFNSKEVVIDSARFSGGGSNVIVAGTKALTPDGINNLTVDGTINLSVFNALSKNTFFAGLATVAVRLTGVNKDSRLNGTADLQNAQVAAFIGSDRLTLDRIRGRILFTSDQAQIERLTGFLSGGRVTANGGATLKGLDLQSFRFEVTGRNFTAPVPPDFITTGDADVEISGVRRNGILETLIAGTIIAKRSIYTEDIDLADFISGRREGSLSSGSSGSASFFGVPKLDLRIEGRDALVVRNNLADLTASASLRVTGDTEYPQISGRITANSGTIFFRKERYEVQRGTLEFPPNTSIEPFINLQAEAEIRGYQVIVSLVGELTNTDTLNATVRSSPALPQADVISLITTGNLANTDTGIPTLAQSGINTAAEILTDELINNPLSKATDKLFGLNRFEIDPIISGQRLNPSARLTVGRQINRNLLVTYSTNLSEDQNQVLALEYRVSNRLSFVAQYEQRSLSNVTQRNNNFSFEIRLRKRF
jgi:translocation and assembly module TamB